MVEDSQKSMSNKPKMHPEWQRVCPVRRLIFSDMLPEMGWRRIDLSFGERRAGPAKQIITREDVVRLMKIEQRLHWRR